MTKSGWMFIARGAVVCAFLGLSLLGGFTGEDAACLRQSLERLGGA